MTFPPWRDAFDRLERAVGRPLESATSSSEFAMTLAVARRLRRTVGRRLDAMASRSLHQLALPSHADMRRVQRKLAAIERQLDGLRRDLDAERPARKQAE